MKRDRRILRKWKQVQRMRGKWKPRGSNILEPIQSKVIPKIASDLARGIKITIAPDVLEYWEWCAKHQKELQENLNSIKKL